MLSPLILVATALLAADPSSSSNDAILSEYETQVANVGIDAASQVRLALWCEANGLSSLRMKHLAIAVLRDPSQPLARGMMGLVEYQGRWLRPEAVNEKVKSDEQLTALLADYNARRGRVGRSAGDHWKLAIWCEQVGLDAEARAHFTTVTRIEPSREAAWMRLGYKKVENRWVTQDGLDAEKAEARAQKKADSYWKPLLARWHSALRDQEKARRERAQAGLDTATDPRALPSIIAVFGKGAADQEIAVRLFGQIDSGLSSRALAMLAVFGESPEVRRAAVDTLERRDARDFVGLLIALIRDPLKYEVKPSRGVWRRRRAVR